MNTNDPAAARLQAQLTMYRCIRLLEESKLQDTQTLPIEVREAVLGVMWGLSMFVYRGGCEDAKPTLYI